MKARLRRARRRLASEGGFTLSEIVAVLAILGIVLAGLTQLFTSGIKAEVDLTRRFEAQQEGRLALDALRREIHCANALTGAPGSSITITLGSYCPTNRTGGVAAVMWCTQSIAASRYVLWRYLNPPVGTTCGAAGGLKKADFLTTGQVFGTYVCPGGSGQRGKLPIILPVDAKPAATGGVYTLGDDIVLRNTRATC
jgi:prepilin-type N-terminal cleavage/methylation domain-containing protein